MAMGRRALTLTFLVVSIMLGCHPSKLSRLDQETITACSLAKVTGAHPDLGKITKFEIHRNTFNTYRVDIAFTDAKDQLHSMRLLATQFRERPAGISSWAITLPE